MDRPSWNDYFLSIARQVATRSTCSRAHVGCVVVRDRRILTTGFNGSPAGMPHCDDTEHLMIGGHCERTIHAEMNAIIQAALHGVSTEGAVAYITHCPCFNCSKALINAGISAVYYELAYNPNTYAIKWLQEANIYVERVSNGC
jgi:dCMP deaminase